MIFTLEEAKALPELPPHVTTIRVDDMWWLKGRNTARGIPRLKLGVYKFRATFGEYRIAVVDTSRKPNQYLGLPINNWKLRVRVPMVKA
jgi:hypothetical protein